eukprot:gnl/TRDRNA2_/TRDRNA2_38871_c0_seq1.p1 gnl/TRDRNA2_/TRDRNA2_38871_c0~~gnl/TRDRNA2_/TRDRNA2_38871_c0_seq1.p1  ORF type:complete len:235 (+),score=47.10 gnl/TRDRNA2_/TRDRNA2_38871_c0_seq1:48-752(+)
MAGCAAAAAGGARRGREAAMQEFGRLEHEEIAKMRKEAVARYEKEKGLIAELMEGYDKDKNGFLMPDEIGQMLADCTLELVGHSEKPTKEEVDCLLWLCDKNSDGRIAAREVLNVTNTWCFHLEKGDETRALLQKYDLSRTGKINHGELRPLLVGLNEGNDVPDDVLKWVWRQADMTGDGTLCQFELTRAIAAWYVWVPEEQPGGKPGMIAGNMDEETMPERPEPQKSAICSVL